jgi:hypothetical protein
MGKGWEGIAASKGSDGFDSRERSYDVGICPQEDRRRSEIAVVEVEGGAKEVSVEIPRACCEHAAGLLRLPGKQVLVNRTKLCVRY